MMWVTKYIIQNKTLNKTYNQRVIVYVWFEIVAKKLDPAPERLYLVINL